MKKVVMIGIIIYMCFIIYAFVVSRSEEGAMYHIRNLNIESQQVSFDIFVPDSSMAVLKYIYEIKNRELRIYCITGGVIEHVLESIPHIIIQEEESSYNRIVVFAFGSKNIIYSR